MLKRWSVVVSASLLCYAWCAASYANAADAEAALAKDSEAYCSSTAAVQPTVKTVIDKVNQAVDLLNKEGVKAFPKFKGKNSEFIFNGTYIWVHGDDGKMLMHPIKPAMVGQDVLKVQDSDGKRFFKEMNDVVNKSGRGWVQYQWPKPGQKNGSVKVSYVCGATVDGKKVIVGCGVYDWTLENVKAAVGAKQTD
jgi:cytochrome c